MFISNILNDGSSEESKRNNELLSRHRAHDLDICKGYEEYSR